MLEYRTVGNGVLSPPSECRTELVSKDFSSCLTEQRRNRCRYACLFVDGYLCTHPNHRDFKSQ